MGAGIKAESIFDRGEGAVNVSMRRRAESIADGVIHLDGRPRRWGDAGAQLPSEKKKVAHRVVCRLVVSFDVVVGVRRVEGPAAGGAGRPGGRSFSGSSGNKLGRVAASLCVTWWQQTLSPAAVARLFRRMSRPPTDGATSRLNAPADRPQRWPLITADSFEFSRFCHPVAG